MAIQFSKYYKILRYLIAGGSAAFVTLSVSFICTSLLHIWYLLSSVIAFCAGFVVSFILQKFWTFSHRSTEKIHHELALYLMVGLINLAINASLMYIFVDIFHIWYLLGQFIATGLIAIFSFPIYQIFIFKQKLQ
ncbi:MAG: GtrA-like protein [Candidatus Paceibacter sp.]|jgi:putative flippase GtrA|nr:GtrA-like protein [Candidatus Paceibacter sp.]